MEKLSAGIIGSGGISDYHINGYLKAGVKVEAISDPVIERAKAQAAKYNIVKIFSSAEEMLKKCPEIKLVSICTPNKYHAEYAVSSLMSGRHVFCEKPPALNAAETEKMKREAQKSGKILMFNFNNRARPEAQALMRYIKNGEVGKINSAQAIWVRRHGLPALGGWFTQKKLSGGGPVIDLLHMIDLSLYFMEFPEPEWVLAQTFNDFSGNPDFKGPWGIPETSGAKMDVETAAHAFIRFKTGQVLFARMSWAETVKREEVSVTFQGKKSGGMIRRLFEKDGIDSTATDDCEIYTMENSLPVNRRIIVEPDEKMGRERSVANFVNTVLGKEKPFSTPAEAVILMKIIDGLYRSAENGKPINLSS